MKWISVKDKLPIESTPMNIHRVIVWDSKKKDWYVGWYVGSLLNRWYVEGSPSSQENITQWMEVIKPLRGQMEHGVVIDDAGYGEGINDNL